MRRRPGRGPRVLAVVGGSSREVGGEVVDQLLGRRPAPRFRCVAAERLGEHRQAQRSPVADHRVGIVERFPQHVNVGGIAADRRRGEGHDLLERVRARHPGLVVALDRRALGDEAVVVDGHQVLVQRRAETVEGRAVRRVVDEVDDLVGIGVEVVQLLGRLGTPEPVLDVVERSLEVELLPPPVAGLLGEHERDVLAPRQVRHVVADVAVALVASGPDEVDGLVHAVSVAERDATGRARGPGERAALEVLGRSMLARCSIVGAASTELTGDSTTEPGGPGARYCHAGGNRATSGAWRPLS